MSVLLDKLDSVPTEDLERVETCPVCGSRDADFMFWNCDRLYHLPGKFGTHACRHCALIRLSPRPTVNTIGKYYPAGYGAYAEPAFSINLVKDRQKGTVKNWIRKSVLSSLGYGDDKMSKASFLVSRFLKPLFYTKATYGYGDRFPEFVSGAKALEIGCGNAAYLSYLKFHGWVVHGLDLSPHAAEAAKKNFDIDVFVGELQNAPFPEASFDYIHLSHVLEHFFDPLESMKHVFRLLKPGGRIYVEVPNADSNGAKSCGEFWYGWDAPRHLFMFSPDTLRATLSKAGFKVRKMTSVNVDSSAWAETYKRESATGEKENVRPGVNDPIRLRSAKKIAGVVRHLISPMSGDFLSCWADKRRIASNVRKKP